MAEDTKREKAKAPTREVRPMIPEHHYRILQLWAYVKGTSPTQLANNIIQARCENQDNLHFIDNALEGYARSRGISIEELKEEILGESTPE